MIPRPADTRGAFFVLKSAEVGHCIEGFVMLMHALSNFPSEGYLDFPPPTRGPHKMHAFCGEPHSGFPPPCLKRAIVP